MALLGATAQAPQELWLAQYITHMHVRGLEAKLCRHYCKHVILQEAEAVSREVRGSWARSGKYGCHDQPGFVLCPRSSLHMPVFPRIYACIGPAVQEL
jgi:hypothetical protein